MLKIIFSIVGLIWVFISFYLEYSIHSPFTQGLFSSSGSFLLVSAIFLNIKHMSFNVKERFDKEFSYAQCADRASEEKEQNKIIKPMILDNIFEIIFMVIGTVIWAYGNILMLYLK